MSGVTVNSIRYNATNSAFEACVDIHSEGRTFRYPCSVNGPLDMSQSRIQSALIAEARHQSSGRTALRTVI